MDVDKDDLLDKHQDLRARAQEFLAKKKSTLLTTSPVDFQKLIHELDTHQIELELQNEDLRQAQEALHVSRKRFSDLYDFAPVGYLTISGKGLIVECNLTAAAMLGKERGLMLKRPLSAYIVKEDQDAFYFFRAKVLQSKHRQSVDLQMQSKQGNPFYANLKGCICHDLEGDADQFILCIEDITEQKRLEEKVLQASKMAAIGNLAGGIAHDFNNILAAIVGFAELAQDNIPDNNPAHQDIRQILSSSQRATTLVQQFLAFSSKKKSPLQPVSMRSSIRETLTILRATFPATIHIQTEFEPENGVVFADPSGIEQIIMNLCTNALDALEDQKGTLTIRLGNTQIQSETGSKDANEQTGSFVTLSVTDTGSGMDQETINRVFEPFFTSKEFGSSSGMGLAVVFGIVQRFKGFVTVDSAPGKGSTFTVHIPKLEANGNNQPIYNAPETKADSSSFAGDERILVVDDEPAIVKLYQKKLERCGYTVSITTESKSALETIRNNPDQFDLLLADQTMPNLSGDALSQAVLQIKPSMPIILCSGQSDLISKNEALNLGIKSFLSKPILGDTLLIEIRRLLDEMKR